MTLLWDVPAALKVRLGTVGVPVYDAGELVGNDLTAYVVVGETGDEGDTATADQTESSLSGAYWRDETGEVPCTVVAWNGGTDLAPLRAVARPLLQACIAAVRADQTLGGLLSAPGLAEVAALRLREGQTDRGALVEAGFTVRYSALLT